MATLRRGSTGPEVTRLQQRLTELDFDPNGIDGKFAPALKPQLKHFNRLTGSLSMVLSVRSHALRYNWTAP